MNVEIINTLLNDINKVSRNVCENQLEQLRLEEELLVNLIRKPAVKTNLGAKSKAIQRVKEINKLQLALLGGS